MGKLYRNSLSLEQNESVELAARLEQKIQSNAEAPDKMSQSKKERLRRKVRTVAKMQRMFKTLRQQNEAVLKLGGMCPGHKLQPSLLAGDGATSSDMFVSARQIDMQNEKMPDAA